MVAFYWITQRVILRPIRQLRAIANNVAEGNLDIRSTIDTGDEYERLAHAFNHQDERQARKETHPKVVEFLKAFKERCGTVTCIELLGADMGTEEGRKKIKEEDLVRKRCPAYGKNAAEILEALL